MGIPPARRMRTRLALQVVERSTDGQSVRVLDAGCEEGPLTIALAKAHPDWSVVGVDLNLAALHEARRSALEAGVANAHFACVDLTRPLLAGSFDAVLAMECLTEIPDDRSALARMADALKPGGLLVAHLPEADWRPVLRSSSGRWRREVRHGYREDDLRAMFAATGLDVTKITRTTRNVVQIAQELRDRYKTSSVKVRALLYPFTVVASHLDRRGITWGPFRAFLVEARRR